MRPSASGAAAADAAVGPEIFPRYAATLGDLLPVDVADVLAYHEAKGEAGEIIAVPARLGAGMGEVLLYGTGDGSAAVLRRVGAGLARRARGRGALMVGAPDGDHAALAEGLVLGSYGFRVGGQGKKPAAPTVVLAGGDEAAVRRGETLARATVLARDLANTPSVDKSPAWLADRAKEIAGEAGLSLRVRTEGDLRAGGFGGLLAVGSGSVRPPCLIELSYHPDGATTHVVLVGKGITFDSGGLSLKPTDSMKLMKTDMAGGAAVMAVLSALPAFGATVRVTGLIAAAENLPSGSAMRPGDVIRHFGGKTSEVLNTDAEGRLVLADALAYADAELDPDVMVDIATLTGAARVALGTRTAALYATDDALAQELVRAGAASGETLWRMPLVDEYRQSIDSDVADVSNIERSAATGDRLGGGSIMAALFLREFVGARRWAHLDIAGPGRATADEGELSKGATGFGARALLCWLTDAAASR
ncbi:MAG TPA: leucyl aminopeptidase family protein [Streptosporangiaceae bacterium]|nr:leucyl aminopeptidase family protein [Streptosporangiaceae bacterium]